MHARSKGLVGLTVLVAASLLACGEGTFTPVDADLSGQWSGSAGWSNDGTTTTMFLDLSLQQDENGALTGTGTYERETVGSSPVTVRSGTHSGGSFTLSLRVEAYDAVMSYSGSVMGTENDRIVLDGTLKSSTNSLDIVLRR